MSKPPTWSPSRPYRAGDRVRLPGGDIALIGAIRFAPLRYRIMCADGWREKRGFAINLPGYPRLRFCCRQIRGLGWVLDHYDTGMSYSLGRLQSRHAAAWALLAHAPKLSACGRLTQRTRGMARTIRRTLQLGRVR